MVTLCPEAFKHPLRERERLGTSLGLPVASVSHIASLPCLAKLEPRLGKKGEINKRENKGRIVSESQGFKLHLIIRCNDSLALRLTSIISPDPRSSSIHLSPSRGGPPSQTNTAILMSAG